MGQLIDSNGASQTIAASGTGSTLEVSTEGHARSVNVLVNDDAGGAPVDYTLVTEVYDEASDTWLQKDSTSTTGASGPTHVSHDAIPPKMRFSITNDDASQQDFHIQAISHR